MEKIIADTLNPKEVILYHTQFRVFGSLALIIGILLLFENFGFFQGIHKIWPVFPLFFAIGLILLFFKKYKNSLKLLGMGTYLALVSILFFFCNFTKWSILKNLWPSFIAFLGISYLVIFPFSINKKFYIISAVLFLLIATVFFLVFALDTRLWPFALILFGLSLFFIRKENE